jgi:hypothetical protein
MYVFFVFPLLTLSPNWDILTSEFSYDSFKIFMGLPTTGGPAPEKKQH